jgi:beta-lactamase class A
LRARLPTDWKVGDKTGSGNHGVANDIAVVWPPGRAPIIVTAYFAESPISADQRDSVLSEVGHIATGV